MKKFLIIIVALAACLMLAGTALALSTQAQSGSASGTTAAELAIAGDSNSKVRVHAVNATSDKAGSIMHVFWSSDAVETTVDAASTGTTLNVTATTGFGVNDLILIQTAGGSVIKRVVSSVNSGVSLVLGSALPATHGNVGDQVYHVGDGATDSDMSWPVGAATVEKTNALGVIIAKRGSPILLILDGTSACTINYTTWDWID